MGVYNDFQNVFSNNLPVIIRRLFKGFLVLKGMMEGKDTASAKMPIRLQLEVTDKCNFDCIMCNRQSRENVTRNLNNDFDMELFVRVIEKMKPFYVTLNGLGEPLLNKEIGTMLAFCRKARITTSMPCNLSVSKILNSELVTNPPDRIIFSIHGATKEVFESISRKANYDACLSAMKKYIGSVDRSKTDIKVLCALQAKNLLEFKNMYNLLKEMQLVEGFCLVPAYDYGGPNTEERRIIPAVSEKKEAVLQIDACMEKSLEKQEIDFYKNWKNVIKSIKPSADDSQKKNNGPCLVPWFSTYIAANGNVLPCCYLTDEHYILGNVLNTPFNEIWNGPEYRNFRKNLREDRKNLSGCNYCSRNDSKRIKKYGAFFRAGSKWKKELK